MTKKILTASGFLLPDNDTYKVFEDSSSQLDTFIGRNNDYAFKTLSNYFVDNKISVSGQADSIYARYHADPTYANFIAMVDFAADILGLVDCYTFMEWQAYNRHVPPMTLMLCRDLLTRGNAIANRYDNLTRLTRFVMNQTITKEEGLQRLKTMMSGVVRSQVSWISVLEPLMNSRGNFLSVFRYIFVSSI